MQPILAKRLLYTSATIDELVFEAVPPAVLPSFSHHRASMGMTDGEVNKMKKAREEFRRKAREQALKQNK